MEYAKKMLSENWPEWNVEETNEMLGRCSMGELYSANPYDCFLQLCMLSEVPLATYDEVMEMSYSKE